MGGFTGLFDRPDPYVTSLTKNRNLQLGINATGGDWTAARGATQSGLGDYIRKYLASTNDAEKYAGQESGAVNRFYNGDMASQLAALRAKRSSAVNAAADVGVQQALRNVDLSRVGSQGGGGSYDKRLAIGAVTPIRTQAALDNANQERADTDYLTGNQIALTGARSGIADRLAGRALVPGQASFAALKDETGGMAPVVGLDQANKYYGIKQEPGLLDRMQQEVQFLQGLQSIMKNQYGTVSEAYGGWAGGGMGGGGGGGGGMGGMGSMMGGMGMRRGGMVGHNYVDHINDYTTGGNVRGAGTGTSDSIDAKLSNGEFVVPANAVRMPGVLALLEKIRAMGNEGPTTAHMAQGGLYYADSFGDLGHQALARDAFNESVVGGQVQQIQQQGQFNATRADQNQQSQDANARSILNQYDAWKNKRGLGAGGTSGYQPMSRGPLESNDWAGEMTFARGGLVYRSRAISMPYGDRARAYSDIKSGEMARNYPEPGTFKGHFAEGGMVHSYAGGGAVDDVDPEETRTLLHKLAQKAATEMLSAPSADTIEQQRLQFEQGRAKASDERQNRQLQMTKEYQDWLMKQPTAAAERGSQVRGSALLKAAQLGISPKDRPDLSAGAAPEDVALADETAQQVRPAYEAQYHRSRAITDLLNQEVDLNNQREHLAQNPPQTSNPLVQSLNPIANYQAREKQSGQNERIAGTYQTRVADVTKRLADIQKQRQRLAKGEEDQNAIIDVNSGRYVPAVPPPHWLAQKYSAPTSIVNQGFEASETRAMPSYAPKYPPQFYNRVNQLVTSGMDARQAKAQAMMEMQEAR